MIFTAIYTSGGKGKGVVCHMYVQIFTGYTYCKISMYKCKKK